MNTELVKKYLRLNAAEHIDGGFEDDERNYSDERDEVWAEMSPAERDTATDLAIGVFGEWIGVA